jgi:hypothetical protein
LGGNTCNPHKKKKEIKQMDSKNILQENHYRLDFPLSNKPIEKRHLEMLQRIDAVQEILKNDLKIHGHRGLKNLTCYAPYKNAASCLFTVAGEPEWLPDAILKIKKDPELFKKDSSYSKMFLQKIFVPSFKPSKAKLKAEEDWIETMETLAKGEAEVMTREADLKRREEEEKRIELLQTTIDTGNGEVGHVPLKK